MTRRILAVGAFALIFAGCSGDQGDPGLNGVDGEQGPAGATGPAGQDGQDGQDGQNGQDGQDGQDGATGPTGSMGDPGAPGVLAVNLAAEEVDDFTVTIDSVTLAAESTVEFTVRDSAGRGAVGLTSGSRGNVRFSIATIVPPAGTGDPNSWRSLVNQVRGDAPNQVTQATYNRTGPLVDNQDGTYMYTFDTDLTAATDPVTGDPITSDPTVTHRLVLQISGSVNGNSLPAVNQIMDFVPDGSAVTETRKIVETDNCNECHGALRIHGSRYDTDYCVVCHNTFTGSEGATKPIADMSYMIHGIHSAGYRAERGGPAYVIRGDDFSHVGYPQDLRHCRKCHEQSAEAPQGDNWKLVPNKNSCGGCHDNATFDTHVATQNNAACALCHGPSSSLNSCGPNDDGNCSIEAVHTTENPTTNNPQIPAGLSAFEYDIDSVTVDANRRANITFRVLRDGASVNLLTPPSDLARGPSFLIAYAMPQDGIASPIDYNNIGNGNSSAQPESVGVSNLASGADGTLTGPDANGYYVGVPNFQFPVGATMRAVTLQGYYQENGTARHAISVVATADGDTARREVVDSAKCANCHEWFEAHGGNRVYEVQACVMCHNPNLSSSGRTYDPARLDGVDGSGNPDQTELDRVANVQAVLGDNGRLATDPLTRGPLDPANPLTYPEESNNLRELVHGIHSAHMHSFDFAFVRIRSNNTYPFNFSHVTYPNELSNCEACHNPGTYDTNLPEGELAGTNIVPSATPDDRAAISAARDTLPNAEDIVTSPGAAACGSCHDNTQAQNHMKLNGAYVKGPRSGLAAGNLETCNVCHGSGRTADSVAAHSGN